MKRKGETDKEMEKNLDANHLKKLLKQILKKCLKAGCDVDPSVANLLALNLPHTITPVQFKSFLEEIDHQGEFQTPEEAQKFIDLLSMIFFGVELQASPQAENGHIDISNESAEALAGINLSAYESRILWAILRKTYGWHKKMDCISISQFERLTGLRRRHVSRTLSELIKRNIVTRIGDTFITNYAFQKDYTQWETITKRGDKKHTVTRIGTQLSPKGVHTKETIQKKSNGRASQKKDVDPGVRDFLTYWGETFLQETGQSYVFSYGKEGKLIKDLLHVHSLETLREVTKSFFKDEQCKRRGPTIGIFFQEINRLLSFRAMNPLEQAKREQRARGVSA
jgi:phage replication O-like protein O